MREKYKNHPLFVDERKKKDPVVVNLENLKKRKEEKEKSIEERVEEYTIKSTEKKALEKVFKLFCDERILNQKISGKSMNNTLNTSLNAKNHSCVLSTPNPPQNESEENKST